MTRIPTLTILLLAAVTFAGFDLNNNHELRVVQRHEQQRLESSQIGTGVLHWLSAPRRGIFPAQVRLRHRQPAQSAQVHVQADGSAQIAFEQPQRAPTPGQFAVLYEAGRCLGGGVVERAGLDS